MPLGRSKIPGRCGLNGTEQDLVSIDCDNLLGGT